MLPTFHRACWQDEGQYLYRMKEDPIWGKLKVLSQRPDQRLRIVMAAMYDSTPFGTGASGMEPAEPPPASNTPFTFTDEQHVTMKRAGSAQDERASLALSRQGYEELLQSFNRHCCVGSLDDPVLRDHLFQVTAGHVSCRMCCTNAPDDLACSHAAGRHGDRCA